MAATQQHLGLATQNRTLQQMRDQVAAHRASVKIDPLDLEMAHQLAEHAKKALAEAYRLVQTDPILCEMAERAGRNAKLLMVRTQRAAP